MIEEEPTSDYLYKMSQRWSIDNTSSALDFKSSDLEDPDRMRFVEVVNIAQNLWANFDHACDTQPGGRGGYEPYQGMPSHELQPLVGELYGKANRFSGAVVEILTDGFGEHITGTDWLGVHISSAIKSYGLEVKPIEGEQKAWEQSNETELSINDTEEVDNANLMFEKVATRLGIEREEWQDPTYRQLIALLVGTDKLSAEAKKALTEPSGFNPSHGPEISDRYRAVVYLLDTMRSIFNAELKGEKVSTDYLKETLGKGLASYELQVVERGDSTS